MSNIHNHSNAFDSSLLLGDPEKAVHPPYSPLLTTPQVCLALAMYLPRKPCTRTIQRWVRRGMPHHIRPRAGGRGGRVQRWFLFSEVYAWLLGAPISRDLAQEAVDMSHRHPKRRKAA